MMRRVLSVGQCHPDQGALSRFLKTHFVVTVETAETVPEAVAMLRTDRFDLVLVNRKLDYDGSDGTRLIRDMQSDAELTATPVMLISNYADAQTRAVQLGAVPGFGKSELGTPATIERLQPYLH